MEEILIISNYFTPEKGAAANRIEQLALQLTKNNYKVTVVCPLPNYPKGKIFDNYKGKFYSEEQVANVLVKRLWIYPSISKNIFKRVLSVLSFTCNLFFYLLFFKTPNKIIIQSPPLLVSFLAMIALKWKRKKLILNISDLWPLAAIELNAIKKESISHRISLFFEKYIYSNASVILGQSNEIMKHVTSIAPNSKVHLYRNFPKHDVEIFNLETDSNTPIRLFYAGLLGIAQGINELCQKINLEALPVELHIFGDGAEREDIKKTISNGKHDSIFFHGMLEREKLHQTIQTFDIALVPLTTRIYGSVPSKIFEYSCLGFPILYFGGGEGETIVHENKLGWVAEVGNFEDLNNKIREIAQEHKNNLHAKKKQIFEYSQRHFDIENQIQYLIEKDVF